MTTSTMAALAERLPLRVRSVEWTDPTLLVSGDDWTLWVTCPWRLVTPKGIALGWSSPWVLHAGDLTVAGPLTREDWSGVDQRR